jgi:patatin-like phospholipase/acyl hydrolase
MPAENLIRVLSIDGGGVRGLIPARLLEHLEAETNRRRGAPKPLSEVFDLIVGTCTGGIIAIGLAAPEPAGANAPAFTPGALADMFSEDGDEIFPRSVLRQLHQSTEQCYSTRLLEHMLRIRLGELTFRDALTNVTVVAYDIERRRPHLFRRRGLGRAQVNGAAESDPDFYLWQAARAATAIPAYFEPARVRAVTDGSEYTLIDGAVFASNPALVALAEARRSFPGEADILVVSLGTGRATQPYTYDRVRAWSYPGWADPRHGVPLLNCAMDGQAATAAQVMAGLLPDDRYFRFDAPLDRASDQPDNTDTDNLDLLDEHARQIIGRERDRLDRLIKLLV